MEKYNPKKIELKWQKYWRENNLNKADDKDNKRPKFYCLDMFPYPSGAGLHVGHVESYTATDIYSRFMRMNGYNVLHPQGWDAFGLPAENYAIKTGTHPAKTTQKSINNFKRQIESLGFSYDWDREINTSDPDYYKWTQWLFLKLYEKGLAYQKKAPVNWCDSCQTVLAREQVIDGKCERCSKQVVQKELKQWFFKITKYANELLNDLKKPDWPEKIKKMQENWIGRSEGALIKFPISNFKFQIEVYTTRPDTIFGATYIVLAPEHDLISKIKNKISNIKDVEDYIQKTRKKTELERTSLKKTKIGVELKGINAINPANKREIPIFIADYVLTSYGTGAIMAVPAHDERDWEFAKKYNLPIIEVVSEDGKQNKLLSSFIGHGRMVNSGKFNDMDSKKAKDEIIKYVKARESTQYKIRDWLISRQRYWGSPIPIIYCDRCGIVTVEEKNLPVELPNDVDFKPTGESPLARSKKFQNVKCPKCHSPARREADTMDTFIDSSWYYLRYADPKNKSQIVGCKSLEKWLPVDLYVGGAEHAVMHLLYARFMTKALHDLGYLNFKEPFLKLRNQGLILASDGRKMSKSLGNVINPDDIVKEYGADCMRMYEMFMGPLEDAKPWDTKGIVGIKRFLERVWNFSQKLKTKNEKFKTTSKNLNLLNNTVKKITDDIHKLRFNTAISAMMIFANKIGNDPEISQTDFEKFLIILSPFVPHLCDELWQILGHKKSIFLEKWPEFKEIKDINVIIPVQVNGKVRSKLNVNADINQNELLNLAKKEPNINKYLASNKIQKIIYIPGKIINIVI